MIPRSRLARLPSVVAFAAILAWVAVAAEAATDPRLATRLDARTAAAVTQIIDAAHAQGLPTEPLVARALEGASRKASRTRIVTAVRNLATALENARQLLGSRSSQADLVAGAAALAAGVHGDTLARLRVARGETSVVVPLVVLTDLITRRVPVETASAAVLAAARANARDADLMRLRERVDADIRAGTSPGDATMVRTRHLVGTLEAPSGAPDRTGRTGKEGSR